MSLHLDIQRKFSARSDRVKHVDFHPREPWVLSALYSGHVSIWNYQTETMVKSIEICDLPLRCARFIPSKQWIVAAGDQMMIYVYNYNTMERVTAFQAHYDYIRYLAVHPTLPLVLSCSDDTTIKLWNWTKNWECTHTYEGHSHYVMQVQFNPKDANSFVSASLDRTIKFWGISSPACHYTLEGHERGVNCVAFLPSGDKPYLVSGGDDRQVRVWDYQTKKNVSILEGHTNNVSSVCFHPSLPIIISGGEDGAVRLWHSGTYKSEEVLNYGMERVWSVSCLADSSKIAIGCDDGMLLIEVGREEPVMSMDFTGKLLWARNNEILSSRVRGIDYAGLAIGNGDKLPIAGKELLTCESFPHFLKHSPNGRMVATCGNGEFIIYTALSLATQHHGPALEFAWGTANGTFAARESSDKIRIYHNSQPALVFKTEQPIDAIFGGPLLAVRCGDNVDLYDWTLGSAIRRLEAAPTQVVWNEDGTIVALCCKDAVYLLRYDADLVGRTIAQGLVPEEGIEGALDVIGEIEEGIRSGCFAGQAFVFTSLSNKIGYAIQGEVIGLGFSESPLFTLGYLAKEGRVYFASARCEVVSYVLPMELIAFQEAIVNGNLDAARNILPQISQDNYPKLATFLESREYFSFALELATDPDQRFDLAVQCKDFDAAVAAAYICNSGARWRSLADTALQQGYLPIAQLAYTHAADYSSLLLLYSMCNHVEGLQWIANNEKAIATVPNVCFIAAYLLGNVQDCIRILQKSGNFAQAALFSRTYAPSLLAPTTSLWKNHVNTISPITASSIAAPDTHPHLFPWLAEALQLEQHVKDMKANAAASAPPVAFAPTVAAAQVPNKSVAKPVTMPVAVPMAETETFFDVSPSADHQLDSFADVAVAKAQHQQHYVDAFATHAPEPVFEQPQQQQPIAIEKTSSFGMDFSENLGADEFSQDFPEMDEISAPVTQAPVAAAAAPIFTPPSFAAPAPVQPVVAPAPATFTTPILASPEAKQSSLTSPPPATATATATATAPLPTTAPIVSIPSPTLPLKPAAAPLATLPAQVPAPAPAPITAAPVAAPITAPAPTPAPLPASIAPAPIAAPAPAAVISPLPVKPAAIAAPAPLAAPAFKPLVSPAPMPAALPAAAALPKPAAFQPLAPLPSALPKLTSPTPLPGLPALGSIGKPLAPLPSLAPLPKPLSGLPTAPGAAKPAAGSNLTKLAEDW